MNTTIIHFQKKVRIKTNPIHNIFKQMFVYYTELTFLRELMLIKQVHQECDICHYWYFLNYSFTFQANVCNRCRNLLMTSLNLSDIAIFNIKGSDYGCIISLISKNDVIKLMQYADLTKKKRIIIKHKKIIFI